MKACPFIRVSKQGVLLSIRVLPRAAHTACAGIHGEALKIRIAAPPVKGAANRELIRFLADQLSLPTAAVRIASGEGGRTSACMSKGQRHAM